MLSTCEATHKPYARASGGGKADAATATLQWMVEAMLRQVGTIVILAALATACGGDRSDTSEAAAFQLRPVVEIVSGSSPRPYVPVTCDAEGRDASRCLDAHAGEPVVILDPSSMDRYELGPVVVDGTDVAEAAAVEQPGTGWVVIVNLTAEGTDELASATRSAVGDRMAMVVDGRVVSVPTVNEPIGSGNVVVAGGLSEAEARALAERLGDR